MRFLSTICLPLAVAIAVLFGGQAAVAEDKPVKSGTGEPVNNIDMGFLSFTLENDIFADTDRNYTNGARLAYSSQRQKSADSLPCRIADHFIFARKFACDSEAKSVHYGFALGQSIFTPEDIETKNPISTQHPYAGWLYGEASVTAVSALDADRQQIESVGLQIGVVGPSAIGEQVQNYVHSKLPESPLAMGWDHQLKDELGVALLLDRRWQQVHQYLHKDSVLSFDIVPHYGASLGNVLTEASAGIGLRIGTYLRNTDLPARVRPATPGAGLFSANLKKREPFNWFLFADITGRAVAQNIFLDGNTFADSPSVDKLPFVADLQMGAGVRIYGALLTYTYVARTNEFTSQGENQKFGSVGLSFRY